MMLRFRIRWIATVPEQAWHAMVRQHGKKDGGKKGKTPEKAIDKPATPWLV